MANKNDQLEVKIVTPNGLALSTRAEMLAAPAVQGRVAILPHHIPFFTPLEPGEIKLKSQGKETFLAVTGGFMDVDADGKITVLTDSAQRSEEIDEKQALKAKQEAEKLLKEREKLSEKEFSIAESSLRKALLDLKVSRRRKKIGQ